MFPKLGVTSASSTSVVVTPGGFVAALPTVTSDSDSSKDNRCAWVDMTAEADVGRRLEWRTGEAALDEGSGAE